MSAMAYIPRAPKSAAAELDPLDLYCVRAMLSEEEQLVQQQLAVKDIASRDARDALDILGRDHLRTDDRAPDVWRVALERGDNRFAERVALLIVPSALDVGWCVLHEA